MAYKIPSSSSPTSGSFVIYQLTGLSANTLASYVITTITSGTFVPVDVMLKFPTSAGSSSDIYVGTSANNDNIGNGAAQGFIGTSDSLNIINPGEIRNVISGQSIFASVMTTTPRTFDIAVLGYYV